MVGMDIKQFSLVCITLACLVTRSCEQQDDSDHKCIYDIITKKYSHSSTPHMHSEDFRQKRQTNDYLPFRITPFIISENVTNSSTNVPKLEDPSGELQSAINYLQSVLSVIRTSYNITIIPSCAARDVNGRCISVGLQDCGPHVTVPSNHLTRTICDPVCRIANSSEINDMDSVGVDTDYILYVTAVHGENCEESTLAYADYCTFDQETYRSLAGFINICDGGLQKSGRSLFNVMLHELLHAIGFSITDFHSFIDENGEPYIAVTTQIINGEEVFAVNSSRVVNYGREYYSCPNLQGVLLENEGGPGSANSHWEGRTLGDEIMNAVISSSRAYFTSVSNFTLNILEDSGWYKVNYAAAESFYNYELLWGRGLGCDFITGDCNTWQYGCPQEDEEGCNYDYQALAYCSSTSVSDGCRHYRAYSNGYCNLPRTSVTRSCFPVIESGSPNSYCYDRQCYRYSSTQQLFYVVEGQLCPYDDAELTVQGNVLTCPSAELICARNTSIVSFDSSTNIPSSWCHSTCATCSRPASQVHCLTCSVSLTLRGTAPTVCVAAPDSCDSGEFLDSSSGTCTACATGCRACTGPNYSDCLACEDESLYRVTTNDPTSSGACITAAECATPTISTFGDRTCGMRQGGGASSTYYNTFLVVLLLLVYSLYQ